MIKKGTKWKWRETSPFRDSKPIVEVIKVEGDTITLRYGDDAVNHEFTETEESLQRFYTQVGK